MSEKVRLQADVAEIDFTSESKKESPLEMLLNLRTPNTDHLLFFFLSLVFWGVFWLGGRGVGLGCKHVQRSTNDSREAG